jgi:acyl carrier protein
MSDTVRSIVEFIDELKAGEGAAPVQPDSRLMEMGLLDSMGLVRLIQFVEERFGISIPDADVTPDLFASPADLAAYVNGRSA